MAKKKVKFSVNPLLGGPSLASRAKMGSPYRELLIDEIDFDPDQPRRVFNEERLQELADSIKEHGIISPILVKVTEGGTYKLVSGERRLRASKIAGLESIPAVIEDDDKSSDVTLPKQLVENLQREDLTVMERAIAIGQLRDAYKLSIREISSKLSISKGLVQRSLEVLDLPDDLQAALINGASETKILVLAKVSNRELRKEFIAQLDNFTRAQLEEEVDRVTTLLNGDKEEVYHGGTPRSRKNGRNKLSPQDEQLINDLKNKLGTRVSLMRSRGKEGQGKLMIEFYSDNDLSEIFRRLCRTASDSL